MKIARRASARHYGETGAARRCRMATPLFIKRFFAPAGPLAMASNLLNRGGVLNRNGENHEKYSACHTALRRTGARPRGLSTRNEHVDGPQYAAGRDAEVVDLVDTAFVDESIALSRVAWNELDRRAAQGRQVNDRWAG